MAKSEAEILSKIGEGLWSENSLGDNVNVADILLSILNKLSSIDSHLEKEVNKNWTVR